MQTLPMPDMNDENATEAFFTSPDLGVADSEWDMLEAIDRILLEHHGLEIGLYDSGTSDYFFTVVRK